MANRSFTPRVQDIYGYHSYSSNVLHLRWCNSNRLGPFSTMYYCSICHARGLVFAEPFDAPCLTQKTFCCIDIIDPPQNEPANSSLHLGLRRSTPAPSLFVFIFTRRTCNGCPSCERGSLATWSCGATP